MSWEQTLFACIVILYSLPSRGNGALNENDCRIVDSYTSPYVTPLFEGTAIVSGCTSQERTSTSPSQEVHVVRIVGGELSTSGRHAKVTLHISPLKDRRIFRDSLVFVLWSHQPVMWEIDSERISNTTRNRFWISSNARITKDNRMHIKVRKRDLPDHAADLEAWVREKYTVINSFIEVQHANHFIKKVGLDPSAPARCVVSSNFHSPTAIATRLQRTVMSGCARTEHEYEERSRDIHILVLDGNASTAGPEHVIVDIKTKKGVARNKDIILVLKSKNKNIRWIVKTGGVRGAINIFTNVEADQVDTDSVMEQVEVSVSALVSDVVKKQDYSLLQWALNRLPYKGPANILSYAKTDRANHFELFVDGGVDSIRHKQQRTRKKMSPFDHPSRTIQAVKNALSKSCGPNLMVALRKDLVLPYGIRKEHLSLLDRDCHFVANDSHYLVSTNPGNCETKARDHGVKMTTLMNEVVIHRLDNEEDLDEDLEGSAILEHPPTGSGYFDDTHVDDEDYLESNSLSVEVSCTSPVSRPRVLPTLKYHLNLFTNASFTQQVTRFPYTPDGDKRVFVETHVTPMDMENTDVSDHHLRSVVMNCWLSAFSEEGNVLKYQVITKGCKYLTSLQWYENGPSKSQRFSFILYEFAEGQEYTMNCQLTLCSEDQNYVLPGVEKCAGPNEKEYYCFTWGIEGTDEPAVSRPTQIVQRGPIRREEYGRIDGEEPGLNDGASSMPTDPTAYPDQQCGRCKQVVRREGLDTGTVVGIAFAAFIIGVALTAALWFIHYYTGPLRKSNRPRSTETSGESTPSSTAPITIHQIHT